MEAGEKELRLHFEEVTARNVKSAIKHGNDTRQIVRDLEERVKHMEDVMIEKDKQLNDLIRQFNLLRAQLYNNSEES